MIIKQLNLDHFGKFHDREIHLEKGINIVYGANESGKSTVHSFIQCMLFGTERLRGRGAGKDIYTKYQPWDGGGSYEGRMRLTCQDQNWRLMRNFHKDDSHLTVIDETGGREIPCREDDISSLIDGMTLSNYRNSISSGQLSLQPDGQFTTGMQSYMANMAMGATDNVDVGKALNYLKEERKKAASKFSHQEYEDCVKEAENLRRKLEGRMALMSQQKALERERENILERIRQLECDVDDAMKQDRQERMKAIRLIQENNDVAAMYKAKKAELREMENQTGSQKYQQHLNDVMEEYEVRQNKLEDDRSRYSELEEQNEGNGIRNLALIFPVAAVAVLVWLAGGLVGLKGIAHIAAAILLTVLAAGFAFMLIRTSGKKKERIEQLEAEIEELESRQQAILEKYQIDDIAQLKERGQDQRSRQEVVVRLRKELENLRRRYDQLQEPLKPYIEKYGESVTLESSAGQKQKQTIQQLRKQASDLLRQSEQLNWQMEQLDEKQSSLEKLETKISELKEQKKNSEEEIKAIELSQKTIQDITARIHGSFGTQLADYISQLFSYITDGAHKKLNIDEKFQVTVDDDRQLLLPQQLSAGTVDQIYFSVRMAVSQMIFSELMPLILDDSFALYDDERLKNTLRWLAEQKAFSQILIFTCHHREAEMLKSLNCDYHYVEL